MTSSFIAVSVSFAIGFASTTDVFVAISFLFTITFFSITGCLCLFAFFSYSLLFMWASTVWLFSGPITSLLLPSISVKVLFESYLYLLCCKFRSSGTKSHILNNVFFCIKGILPFYTSGNEYEKFMNTYVLIFLISIIYTFFSTSIDVCTFRSLATFFLDIKWAYLLRCYFVVHR